MGFICSIFVFLSLDYRLNIFEVRTSRQDRFRNREIEKIILFAREKTGIHEIHFNELDTKQADVKHKRAFSMFSKFSSIRRLWIRLDTGRSERRKFPVYLVSAAGSVEAIAKLKQLCIVEIPMCASKNAREVGMISTITKSWSILI